MGISVQRKLKTRTLRVLVLLYIYELNIYTSIYKAKSVDYTCFY